MLDQGQNGVVYIVIIGKCSQSQATAMAAQPPHGRMSTGPAYYFDRQLICLRSREVHYFHWFLNRPTGGGAAVAESGSLHLAVELSLRSGAIFFSLHSSALGVVLLVEWDPLEAPSSWSVVC